MGLLSTPLLLLLSGCVTAGRDQCQRNCAIVSRYFEQWANQGDVSVADKLIATNLTLRNPPFVLHSLAEYTAGMRKFHEAFPDLHFTMEDHIAEGDKVVIPWTLRGTQLGEYQGRAPTGKAINVTGISIFRLSDGKIQEITVNMDRLGLWQQLGLVPETPPPK